MLLYEGIPDNSIGQRDEKGTISFGRTFDLSYHSLTGISGFAISVGGTFPENRVA